MGYPMTFQRLLNRNGLADGDYETAPSRLQVGVNIDSPGKMDEDDFIRIIYPRIVERLRQYDSFVKLLAGDLRRLERDSVDEQATASYIASRTGIEPDVVAAVLKEYMAW